MWPVVETHQPAHDEEGFLSPQRSPRTPDREKPLRRHIRKMNVEVKTCCCRAGAREARDAEAGGCSQVCCPLRTVVSRTSKATFKVWSSLLFQRQNVSRLSTETASQTSFEERGVPPSSVFSAPSMRNWEITCVLKERRVPRGLLGSAVLLPPGQVTIPRERVGPLLWRWVTGSENQDPVTTVVPRGREPEGRAGVCRGLDRELRIW